MRESLVLSNLTSCRRRCLTQTIVGYKATKNALIALIRVSLNRTIVGLKAIIVDDPYITVFAFESNYSRIERRNKLIVQRLVA